MLYEFLTVGLVALSAGIFLGHAAGYARGKASMRARYRRVGNPE